ncbi:MAG: hypothetical protein B6D41_11840 [Chloroflexi bacterium UTCFX4]|jgi:hypothetical protein|nr:MAG: hypothetical protein B6D41_11840 [Chloroflexi bacterium UTCFX4]
MSRTYRQQNYRHSNRRPKDFLRRNYDALALAAHFEDGLSALAFAVIFFALSDLRKAETRVDAERFLQDTWFDTLAEGLELSPEHWRQMAERVTAL